MARIARFASQFFFPLSADGTTKIYPAGWAGEVGDDVAAAMMKADREAELDPVVEKKSAAPKPTKPDPSAVSIPEAWRDMTAADLVALARSLGAPSEVSTKVEAMDFVGKVVVERTPPQA
jgi:hypothetical protein